MTYFFVYANVLKLTLLAKKRDKTLIFANGLKNLRISG
jgi:hypothetical protein